MSVDFSDVWGEPRMYKNSIPIYPIRMKDASLFYEVASSLNIPKNTIQDPQIIKMSYVRFILAMAHSVESFEPMLENFKTLLKLVFRAEKIEFYETDKGRIVISIDDNEIIRESEFPRIRTIIAEQNLIEIEDDKYLNPEVRQKILEAKEFIAKKGNKIAPLDQRIFAYRCVMKAPYSEIQELTLYQFNRELERYSHIEEADAILHARYSGMVSFKDESKLPTWLSKIEKSEDELVVEASKFKDKISEDLSANNK